MLLCLSIYLGVLTERMKESFLIIVWEFSFYIAKVEKWNPTELSKVLNYTVLYCFY